ncbi:MAG: FAD-dependent oxidoreductase, partial [Chloroflexaceae bacterium]|nr:FAD-dependent oxidoreductase [Chloroflexaceae bacterium]
MTQNNTIEQAADRFIDESRPGGGHDRTQRCADYWRWSGRRSVVHAIRQAGQQQTTITLIKDEEINANRCAIPYGINPAKPLEKYCIPNTLVTNAGAQLVIDTVERIEPVQKRVFTRQSGEYTYDQLVLATGARPLVPSIPGIDADGIIPVRSRDDMARIREASQQHRRVVVVGGGYIGVEVAVVLRQLGLDVTIVEMLPHVVAMTVDPELITDVEQDLTSNGIVLATSARVVEFQQQQGHVCGVVLDDKRELPADFVVLAVGVIPNTDLAQASGLQVSRFGIIT